MDKKIKELEKVCNKFNDDGAYIFGILTSTGNGSSKLKTLSNVDSKYMFFILFHSLIHLGSKNLEKSELKKITDLAEELLVDYYNN